MENVAPALKQPPEQESGNTAGKGIQHEEQQGCQKQVTGTNFHFDYRLSVETTCTIFSPNGHREGPPPPLLLNTQLKYGTEESGHQLGRNKVSAITMDSPVYNMEDYLNNQGRQLQVIEDLLNQLVGIGVSSTPPTGSHLSGSS